MFVRVCVCHFCPLTCNTHLQLAHAQHVVHCRSRARVVVLQRAQVHASRRDEADGEHADAVGADPGREGALPHHGGHHLRQRDPLGRRACLHRAVGVSLLSLMATCRGRVTASRGGGESIIAHHQVQGQGHCIA